MMIAPGILLPPMLEPFPQSVKDALATKVPPPSRLGKPAESAQPVETIVRTPLLNGELIRQGAAIA